jgi:cytochrome c-type biogenesis protein CcsB
MKALIDRFASLRVTVTLLVLLLVALAAGTIVESLRGAEAALGAVYGAPWFYALLAVFALNLSCSLVSLWPWGKRRVGYALTHLSMLVILGGALTTELGKTEGQLLIFEGEEARTVVGRPASPEAQPPVVATLPFAVRLDAFEIDYYEGTRRPAQFRSRVTIEDAGREIPAAIWMNHELAYGGYKLFQSSYRESPDGKGPDQTILSVSKDPGEPIVFLGYCGLVAGMIVVLITRIRERRRALQPAAAAALLALLAAAPASAQPVPPLPSPADVEVLRRLPVQHDGRVMPLDTLAREAVWNVTGRGSVWGVDPVAMVLGWTFDPSAWEIQPVVRVADRALAEAISLPPGASWSSFRDLAANERLAAIANEAQAAEQQERPLTRLQKSAQKLEGRLYWMVRFFRQEAILAVPAEKPGEAWTAPSHLRSAADLRAVVDSGVSAGRLAPGRLSAELLYNRVRHTRIAWWVLTLALLLSIAATVLDRRALDLAAGAALLAGFAVMSWGIGLRWHFAGRIPASNMYESMLFLGWGVGFFAVVATLLMRNRLVVLNAGAGSALAMALVDLLPMDRFIHPMPPVLSGTYWLAVHVPIIMVGYAVLALGMVVAHMQIGVEAFAPARRTLALKMAELQYFYIHVGSILLVAGIMTGSMWAASSWGRYWGWDPKEVWSLVAFLAYMAILHARAERLIGTFGVAAWSIVAFQTILMTYLGVNFVLAAGLHSYGFGDSSVVRSMVATALVEGTFIAVAWASLRKTRTT